MGQERAKQLADRIQEIVARMLERRVKDPRLGFVTVTDAKLTGDLREATVFYTVMGGPEERAASAAALRSATGLIRSEVGRQLGLRHTPSLTFVADAVPETAAHIEELIRKAQESDAEVARRAANATYSGEPDPYRVKDAEDDEADLDAADTADADANDTV